MTLNNNPKAARALRLREAREFARFTSMRSATEKFGWVYNTYRYHEDPEQNDFGDVDGKKYAAAYGVNFAWLMTGEGDRKGNARVFMLCGVITSEGKVENTRRGARNKRQREVVLTMDFSGIVGAFLIPGPEQYTNVEPETVLLCAALTKDIKSVVGKPVVCCASDGLRRYGKIEIGSKPGLYNLKYRENSVHQDLYILWAAPIAFYAMKDYWRIQNSFTEETVLPYPECLPVTIDQARTSAEGGGAQATPARSRSRRRAA